MARFYDDPLGFVMYAYKWDSDPALQIVKLPDQYRERFNCEYGPDQWACEFFDDLGAKIKDRGFDGIHAVDPIRMSTISGHGIGKSATTAMLVNFIMSTRPYCKGTVTANTAAQLSSKTWSEVAKWTKRCITGHWFEISTGKGAMRMRHLQHKESWFCDAQTCREENSEAFAGQHAVDSTSFYIIDEASRVPNKIWEVAEGGLTDGEPMIFAFGNGTQNSGAFYDTHHKMRHRWSNRQIDSRNVAITNKALHQQWIDDYGLDSDFVKVRVRGMFPSMSVLSLISEKDVDAAYGRQLRKDQYDFAPVIITCDPAWTGEDELVIGKRQGLVFHILRVMPKNDNDYHVATILAALEDEHMADAVIIDAGYGTGIYSAGKTMGRQWHIVWFSAESKNPGCINKRAEMGVSVRDWLKEGGCIPEDVGLHDELISIETVPRADGKIQLESKKDAKARGLVSPNRFDALGLSFALPVQKKNRTIIPGARTARATEYDPYARNN